MFWNAQKNLRLRFIELGLLNTFPQDIYIL